ncbi:MAG: hypothetical protein K8R68_05100, partial [Bacteroidales bacterium]|nr:hypothetical protein [Bacteroidales bacterium]
VFQEVLDKYKGIICYLTEKLDGSSVTYYVNDDEFGVCSRNLELIETEDNTLWKLAREQKIEEKLKSLNKNIAIQGEIIGEGVQGNKYKLSGQDVYFFNLFMIDEYKYPDFDKFVKFCKDINLKTVPIINTNYKLSNNIEELVELSIGRSTLHDVQREGIVFRPLKEINDTTGRVSFKAVSPKFLLKFE